MPELPEVEVVRRGLQEHVVERRIVAVEVLHPRAVRRHPAGPDDFAGRLAGRRVTAARRRGKYLWLPLDDGDAMIAHLGMSGQLLVDGAEHPDPVHLRVRLSLDDGRELRFVDQRTFGGLALSADGAVLPHQIAHIARDPLDPSFDADAFTRRLRMRRTGVKRALLDQTLISGVGNIYADEALWRARLHYEREARRLRRAEVETLLAQLREVMVDALAQGGTSFDALYVNVNGRSGYFDRSLKVYGLEGHPCQRCGTALVREKFMNRSSHFCPVCQRKR